MSYDRRTNTSRPTRSFGKCGLSRRLPSCRPNAGNQLLRPAPSLRLSEAFMRAMLDSPVCGRAGLRPEPLECSEKSASWGSEKAGGKLHHLFFTFGDCDIVALAERFSVYL